MEKTYIATSKIAGKGCFANQNIKKDEIIFIAKGVKKKDSYDPNYEYGSHWMAIGKYKWLSPLRSNSLWFINHSCEPNAGLKRKINIVAMKNIKKGKEITLDYSTTEDDPYWKMKCSCGNKNCRKIIRNIHFLPENFLKKYKSYIPKWLQKSYIKNRQKVLK